MTTLSYAPHQSGVGTLFGTDPFAQLGGYGAQQGYGPQQFGGFGPQQPMPITQVALIPIPWQGQPYGMPQQQYGGIPQLTSPLPVLVPLGTPQQQYYPQQIAWQPYGQPQFQPGQPQFQPGQPQFQQGQLPFQQGQLPFQQWGPQGQQFVPQTTFGFGPPQGFTQGYGQQRPMSY